MMPANGDTKPPAYWRKLSMEILELKDWEETIGEYKQGDTIPLSRFMLDMLDTIKTKHKFNVQDGKA